MDSKDLFGDNTSLEHKIAALAELDDDAVDEMISRAGIAQAKICYDRLRWSARLLQYSGKYNELMVKCLKYFNTSDTENIVFSPYSILIILTLMMGQTAGATRQEIIDALGSDKTYERFFKMVHEMYRQCSEEQSVADDNGEHKGGGSVTAANALFVRKDIRDSLNPEYLKKTGSWQSLYTELFCSDSHVSDINAWVKEKTKGMITEIADDSISEVLFSLVNAVAFEAEWEEEYDEEYIKEGKFTNLDGSVSRVQYLDSLEETYIEDSLYTGFAKPYKGGEYSFVALLPRRKSAYALNRVIGSLDFNKIKSQMSFRNVDVRIPEFEGDFEENLTGFMKELGVRTAFTPEADYSSLSSEQLKLEYVIHKAHIEVDRQGTRAAAATMEICYAGEAPDFDEMKYVNLDRPFVYAIVHNKTGLPVFTGVVKKL
jgi:serpin B